jgi:hypothetical protein
MHSNGSHSIVACVFVAAGMCLPSLCLAMNVYSDSTISDFGRHVTIPYALHVLIPSPEVDVMQFYSSGSRQEVVAGSCEHGNEPWVSIRAGYYFSG